MVEESPITPIMVEQSPPFKPTLFASGVHLFAGSISGAISTASGYPWDTVKVRLQVDPGSHRRTAARVLVETLRVEGPRGLFKGMSTPVLGEGIIQSAVFCSYGTARMWFQHWNGGEELSLSQTVIAGTLSGLVAAFAVCPIDLIKVKLQVQGEASMIKSGGYTGPIHVARVLYHTHGIAGLYKGLITTICRDMPSYGVYFWSYEWTRRLLLPSGVAMENISWTSQLLAGGIAGMASWASTYPQDVIKTRLQSQRTQGQYKGFWECGRVVVKEGGWAALFVGLQPCLQRAFLTNAVALYVYEKVIALSGVQ